MIFGERWKIIKPILILQLATLIYNCSPLYSSSNEILWNSNGVQLKGTLLIPSDSIKSLVILIHGSGNIDRSNRSYSMHAEKLEEMGLAVFYYDKPGVGESGGDWKNSTFGDLAIDACSVIPKLREFPELQNVNIGFLGLSQGGWINLLANELYDDAKFLITISGSVATPEEQTRYINRKILENNGYKNLEIFQAADTIDKVISEVYRSDSGWVEAEKFLENYKNEDWYRILRLGLQPRDSWNWKWYAKLPSNFNPKPFLEQLNIPLFAAHGGKDLLIDGMRANQYLDRLKNQGKNITNFFDPKGNHLLGYKENFLIFWKRTNWQDNYWSALRSWLEKEELI